MMARQRLAGLLLAAVLIAASCGADDDAADGDGGTVAPDDSGISTSPDDGGDGSDGGEGTDPAEGSDAGEEVELPEVDPSLVEVVSFGDVGDELRPETLAYMQALHMATDEDVRFNLTECPVGTGSNPGPCVFPVAFSASSLLVIGNDGDGARLAQEGFEARNTVAVPDGRVVYVIVTNEVPPRELAQVELSLGASIVPDHYFGSAPIHRGHPVDLPEDADTRQHVTEPPDGETGRTIGLIDTDDSDPVVGRHGPFIASILRTMGQDPDLRRIDAIYSAEELAAIYFREQDIIPALATLLNDYADGQGTTLAALNLSFGTYGHPERGPAGLAAVLAGFGDRLPEIVVASAGNDETDQPVFPAAFDDVTAVGSVDAGGDRSCFSNFGDWLNDWHVGEEVVAVVDDNNWMWSGTSFAAPQVAAELAAGGPTPNKPAASVSDIGEEIDPTWGCGVSP